MTQPDLLSTALKHDGTFINAGSLP